MLTGFCKEFNLFPGLPVEAVRNSAVRLCYHLVATLKCSFLSKLWSFIRVLICLFFLFISIFYKLMQNNFLSSPCCLHQHQTHIHVCSFHVTYLHERAHISDACRVVRCVNVSVRPDVIFFKSPTRLRGKKELGIWEDLLRWSRRLQQQFLQIYKSSGISCAPGLTGRGGSAGIAV